MMEGGTEDFGFVQRSTDVLEMAEKGGKKEEEEEEDWESEKEGEGKGGRDGEGGRDSVERKSGGLSSPEVGPTSPAAATAATGDTGARKNRSDWGSGAVDVSGGSGGSKEKVAGRLLRTMSSYLTKEGKPPSSQAVVDPTLSQLPQTFVVKYLGKRDARGLWGIKHTRKPVDLMVEAAKGADGQPPLVLPLVKLTVSKEGVTLTSASPSGAGAEKKKKTPEVTVFHPIDTISYGVQDLVYTRVFSMIIVRETAQMLAAGRTQHPFQCHGFVCDSRNSARRLTYVLASAFQEFSRFIKEEEAKSEYLDGTTKKKRTYKKFAIDLRTPEQIEQDLKQPDSEA